MRSYCEAHPLRNEFRKEFLEAPPPESVHTIYKAQDDVGPDKVKLEQPQEIPQEPTCTPVCEMIDENKEENLYLTMPNKLKDKFVPLHFVPSCTKELSAAGSVFMTPEMLAAAETVRGEQVEAALARTRELQKYNEKHILERQKIRCQMLERFFTDSTWSPEVIQALEKRDEAVAEEALCRVLSAAKKKEIVKEKKK